MNTECDWASSGSAVLQTRTLTHYPALEKRQAGFKHPAHEETSEKLRLSFDWAVNSVAVPCSLSGSLQSFLSSELQSHSGCAKAAAFLSGLRWHCESQGWWSCDCGVAVCHKQDSREPMFVCRDFLFCSLWFPLWRTEYLSGEKGREVMGQRKITKIRLKNV